MIKPTESMKLLDVVPAPLIIGICAYTLEGFKKYMDSVKIDGLSVDEWRKAHPEIKDYNFLTLSLPCGCSKNFKDKKDVPSKSVKCKHGNYFIKIGDDPENAD